MALSKIENRLTDMFYLHLQQLATIFNITVPVLLMGENGFSESALTRAQRQLTEREAELKLLQAKTFELSTALIIERTSSW